MALSAQSHTNNRITITQQTPHSDTVLRPQAMAFLVTLHDTFASRITELLQARSSRQESYNAGYFPDFNPDTVDIREAEWTAAPLPHILHDRRVEITGPVDRKMIINALNSGAKVFMADFEDASSPTFNNMLDGQINILDYTHNRLEYTDIQKNKIYTLNDKTAVLMIRPRGLHMIESHVLIDTQPIPASLFDFGLHFFHNAKHLDEQGRGVFYYLPKMESHIEARLWNDIFVYAQNYLDIPQQTIKATVLIETLPAAFCMDEIIYELRDHIAGLNCGRWDYIFSYIKTLKKHSEYILPDRSQVTMDKAFLKAYSELLVETCHRRNIHAMGGMAAQIPVKNNETANKAAFDKVTADKLREVTNGHDGTWVAHPDLISIALEVFNSKMPNANQIDKPLIGKTFTQKMLLEPHEGTVTEQGIRTNISVAIEYLTAWLNGRGAVPIHNLMEDAATAEISRSQLWQWFNHKVNYSDELGNTYSVTRDLLSTMIDEELAKIKATSSDIAYDTVTKILKDTIFASEFETFITNPSYKVLCK